MDISITLILNIVFLVIVLLCGLIGFIRGTLKSGYFMVATLLVFIIGFLLMAPISGSLVNINLSSFNLVIDGIVVETPMQFIQTLVDREYAEYAFLFEDGSQSLDLIKGAIGMAIKIVYSLLLVIGSFTIFYLIFGIVWLCTKKPIRKLFNKNYNNEFKYRVNFTSRLGGFGIGVLKGLFYSLLIGSILAGVASIAKSAEEVVGVQGEVVVVCANDSFTVVELSSNLEEVDEDSANQMFEYLQAYRETFVGEIFGCVKFGEYKTTFDEFMFDSLFSINTKNGNVKLRKELQKLGKILSSDAIQSVMTDEFDINKLYQLNKEDLKEIVDLLSELDIIKVVVPVGIEFIAYSESLMEEFGSDFASVQELIQAKYNELVELDYCSEVKNLGYVLVDIIDLLGEGLADPSKIDFLNLDQETINQIFANLNNVELLEVVAPVTINYLLNMETVKEAVAKTGFTVEDLGLNSDINYVDELMNLPKIYETLTKIGLKYTEGKIDLTNVDYTKVEGFVEALFDSVIVQNAVPVVATTLVNTYLPDEFSGIFTKEEVENVKWEEEFSPLLTAAVVLLNSGILDADDKMLALTNLEDEKINDLGKYISQSKLFTDNLNEVVESLLKTVLHDSISYNGLDKSKGEIWDENEITSLFRVMKKLASGISFDLSDEEYEDLAITLTSSKYVKKNLNNIVSALTASLDVSVSGLEDDEWTVNEIYSTFKAVSIIMGTEGGGNVSLEQMLKLDDQKLNVILESKMMKEMLVSFINEKSKPGQSLELLKGVYEDGIDENGNKLYSWDDKLIDVESSYSNGILTIKENKDVIQYNIYKNGRFLTSTKETVLNNLNNNTYTVKGITQKGEIRKVFNAISKLQFDNVNQFNIDLRNVIENKEILLDSYIISLTLIDKLISLDVTNGGSISIPTQLMDTKNNDWYGNNGELSDTFASIDYLLGVTSSESPVYIDSLNDKLETMNFANIINNKDEILKSKIVSLTIVKEIRGLNGSGLYLPSQYMNDDELWYSEYDKNNVLVKHNELNNLLCSLDLVVDSGSLSNIDELNVEEMLDSIIKVFENEEESKLLLSSVVFDETVKENILNAESLKSHISKAFGNYGKNSDSSNEWYSFDKSGNPERKELWNIMKGLSIILDDQSFDSINEFTIEMIIENENMIPVYDSQYNVVSSNIGILLNSIIFEEIFASVVKDMCKDDGYLALVINIPSDVNWYRKDVSNNEEYDLKTFMESFFLVQGALDFKNIKNIEESGNSLRNLSQSEVDSLATGMVISRIFKGSIADMFNVIFTAEFAKVANDNNYSVVQKLELATWWSNNMFDQKDYDGSKVAARTKFIEKFNEVCNKLK